MILGIDPGKWNQAIACMSPPWEIKRKWPRLESVATLTIQQATLAVEEVKRSRDSVKPVGMFPTVPNHLGLIETWYRFFMEDIFWKYDEPVDWVVIEKPDFMGRPWSNKKVRDLADLGVVIGSIVAAAAHVGLKVRITEPREWKGSESKDDTAFDVRRYLKNIDRDLSDHETDAIGIAEWWVRRLQNVKDNREPGLGWYQHPSAIAKRSKRKRTSKKRRR